MFMKAARRSACALFLVCSVLLPVLRLSAQTAQDQQKAVEMYMKLGAVGEHHAYLKQLVGEWKVSVSMWMFPGSPPTPSQTRAKGELILGGRFLRMTHNGSMMGQPFEGVQTLGYDNFLNKYVSLWVDNTSTSFYLTTGSLDPATKILTEEGVWPDPMSGGKVKIRNVTKWLGPDEFRYETYMTLPNGTEFKSMEERAVRLK
ncbi:MAG: DUF1579 domain-containing protein [Candidatus Aminicenantales bacterium]